MSKPGMLAATGIAGLIPLTLSYALCSSTLLVANKWALELFPKPNLLMFFQFFTSWAVVAVMAGTGLVVTDPLEKEKVRRFFPVVLIFYAVLWANLKALDALSVDLVILFRSLTPFAISFGDYMFLGRMMPSLQSWFSLGAMSLCTAFIFVREPHISGNGLLWGVLYYFILAVDMVYLKKIISDVKLTTFGRVVYTNLLAAGPAIVLAIAFGEFNDIAATLATAPPQMYAAVLVTCILGFGMSYLSWALRAKVSALTFVVIGILCKIGSVIINATFLSKHLTIQSMILVCLGIMASTLYEQPDARKGQVDVNKVEAKNESGGSVAVDIAAEGKDEAEVPAPRANHPKRALMVSLIAAICVVQFWEKIVAVSGPTL